MPRFKSFSGSDTKPSIGVYSYPTKGLSGVTAQFEFDVSGFRDPAGQKQFKGRTKLSEAGSLVPLNGVDSEVYEWVAKDPRIPAIIGDCRILAEDQIRPKADGKALSVWLSLSFKDYHGIWIAPAVAELVANALSDDGFNIVVHHFCEKTVAPAK